VFATPHVRALLMSQGTSHSNWPQLSIWWILLIGEWVQAQDPIFFASPQNSDRLMFRNWAIPS
jgi:hypothetical protein